MIPCFISAFFCLKAALLATLAALADLTTDTAFGMLATVPPTNAVVSGLFATADKPLLTMLLLVFAITLPPVNGAFITPATFFSRSICPALLKNLFLNTATQQPS